MDDTRRAAHDDAVEAGDGGRRREAVERLRRVLAGDDRFDALERAARGRGPALGPYPLLLLLVRAVRRTVDVRVTGLAAEMTYYAVISLFPLATAAAAGLGYLGRLLGAARVDRVEETVVDAVGLVLQPDVTADVVAPLVAGLLRQERAGIAVGSVAVALWLGSRVFRAAIRALDDAYTVPERRGVVAQTLLGLGLSLGAVVTFVVVLAMVVVGPLLGGGQALAESVGQGEGYDAAWGVLRWPVAALVSVAFLALVHRVGPNVENSWRECLPGAVLGTVGMLGVAVAFRGYLTVAGPVAPDLGRPGEALAVATQTLGAALAAVLWVWFSSIAVLVGGVLNAELERLRAEADPAGPEGRRRRGRRQEVARHPDPRSALPT